MRTEEGTWREGGDSGGVGKWPFFTNSFEALSADREVNQSEACGKLDQGLSASFRGPMHSFEMLLPNCSELLLTQQLGMQCRQALGRSQKHAV